MNYNFTIKQGEDFLLKVMLKNSSGEPIDLTSLNSFVGKARLNFSAPVGFEFDFLVADQTTEKGQFSIILTSTKSAAIDVKKPTRFIYDVKWDGSPTKRILQGSIEVLPEVSY